MEGGKQVGSSSPSRSYSSSSSPSFASELFGSKETYPSSSYSAGIFGSIFGPPSKVVGREILRTENENKRKYAGEGWKNITGDATRSSELGSESKPSGEINSIYQEQREQPCHLSSSIYYGGQENYSHPQNTLHSSSGFNSTTYKKDSGENDSGSASRGNWWQGSLYY